MSKIALIVALALLPSFVFAENKECLKQAVEEILEAESDESNCESGPELQKLKLTLKSDTYASYILSVNTCDELPAEYSVMTESLPRKLCKITSFKM